MAKQVTQAEKEKMWQLYQKYGTCTAVAKKMNRNASTVSRYVREYETAIGVAGYILKNTL